MSWLTTKATLQPVILYIQGRGMKNRVAAHSSFLFLFALFLFTLLLFTRVSQAADFPVSQVTRQSTPENYVADAVVEAVQQATVAAETSGRIKQVLFDVDDVVKKGDVLIRFNDRQQQANLNRANAQLNEAEARLTEANAEYKRVKSVFEKKLVPQSALDKASADLKAAKQRANAANASVKQAQEQLSYTVVKAPYDGIVVKRFVEVGEAARPGTPLMSGFSLEKLRATAIIPQAYVSTIRRIGKAHVYLEQPESMEPQDVVEVKKLSVFPYADPQSHGFKVRLQLPKDASNYYPGMWLKATFELGSKERLLVPIQAIVHRSEVTAVYVVGTDGKISFRQVRVGNVFAGNQREVLAGLSEGETVALDPVRAGVELKQQRSQQIHAEK